MYPVFIKQLLYENYKTHRIVANFILLKSVAGHDFIISQPFAVKCDPWS